jgi:hypothetical protein
VPWTLKLGNRNSKLGFFRLDHPWRFFNNLARHCVKDKDLTPKLQHPPIESDRKIRKRIFGDSLCPGERDAY